MSESPRIDRPLPSVPDSLVMKLVDQSATHDDLDSFVLTGGITSVEDILNQLVPNGEGISSTALLA